jgi:hypothetical protein
MQPLVARLLVRHRGPIALVAIVLVAFALLQWWLSMADASMTGCGGG